MSVVSQLSKGNKENATEKIQHFVERLYEAIILTQVKTSLLQQYIKLFYLALKLSAIHTISKQILRERRR